MRLIAALNERRSPKNSHTLNITAAAARDEFLLLPSVRKRGEVMVPQLWEAAGLEGRSCSRTSVPRPNSLKGRARTSVHEDVRCPICNALVRQKVRTGSIRAEIYNQRSADNQGCTPRRPPPSSKGGNLLPPERGGSRTCEYHSHDGQAVPTTKLMHRGRTLLCRTPRPSLT